MVILAVNSQKPLKIRRILTELGDESHKLASLFDKVYISAEIGVEKPDPNFLLHIMQDISADHETLNEKTYMIGDMIDREIACAQYAGVRSI